LLWKGACSWRAVLPSVSPAQVPSINNGLNLTITKMKVKSETNVVLVFVVLVVGGLFFILLGTLMIFVIAPDYPLIKQLGLTATGLGFYAFATAAAVNYFKSTPEVIVTPDELRIKHIYKSETIKADDISEVLLNQKSLYKFLFLKMPMESSIVKLKDGSSRIFWDFNYDGFGRIKNALKLSIDPSKQGKLDEIRNNRKKIVKPIDKRELATESFIDYKGTGILNFYGLVLSVFFGVMLYNMNEENMIRGFVIFTILVGLSGYHLHYFRLSDHYFQVRNLIWFWKSKTYRIKDIQEIIREHPHNTPESIRIRLQNYYTSNLQPAGSFREKDWKELFEHLRRLNVKIRSA
jgi:hypothetical protein